MQKIIGLDLGYGFSKITDGSRLYSFPSVVGQARSLSYISELSSNHDPVKSINLIIDDREYFVGELANYQSPIILFSLTENRSDEQIYKVLLLSALSLFFENSGRITKLVTGLPISSYFEMKDSIRMLYQGSHQLIKKNLMQNTETKITLEIEKIQVIPQPIGTLYELVANQDGVLIENNLTTSRIGIIDIGFHTTDYLVIDHMENIDRLSGSCNIGVGKAYSILNELIKEQLKIEKPIYQLDALVQTRIIKVFGKPFDLSEVIEHAFQAIATKIIAEVDNIWTTKWELDQVYICGGGAAFLYKYLQPRFETALLLNQGHLSNVCGFYKLGRRLQLQHLSTNEQFIYQNI